MVSGEYILICRLRGSLCRRQWVVCFITAPLVLWDGVWLKASGHRLPWRVQWWMFTGNLGHCSRNTINSVTVSQHNWEELYCGMCLCIQYLYICVPTNAIVFKKVCVCILQLIWGKGLQDYSCLFAVGSSWAMLPIGHSHEPLLFKGHCRRQQWGQGSVSPLAYTTKLPVKPWKIISAYACSLAIQTTPKPAIKFQFWICPFLFPLIWQWFVCGLSSQISPCTRSQLNSGPQPCNNTTQLSTGFFGCEICQAFSAEGTIRTRGVGIALQKQARKKRPTRR